jgi:hypothetical protein
VECHGASCGSPVAALHLSIDSPSPSAAAAAAAVAAATSSDCIIIPASQDSEDEQDSQQQQQQLGVGLELVDLLSQSPLGRRQQQQQPSQGQKQQQQQQQQQPSQVKAPSQQQEKPELDSHADPQQQQLVCASAGGAVCDVLPDCRAAPGFMSPSGLACLTLPLSPDALLELLRQVSMWVGDRLLGIGGSRWGRGARKGGHLVGGLCQTSPVTWHLRLTLADSCRYVSSVLAVRPDRHIQTC